MRKLKQLKFLGELRALKTVFSTRKENPIYNPLILAKPLTLKGKRLIGKMHKLTKELKEFFHQIY